MPYAMLREDGRIIDWSHDEFEGGVEISNEPNAMGDGLLNYVVRDGEAVYDLSPEHEIIDLEALLDRSDYIAAKIAEGAATKEEYAEELEQRQAWRDRINELE